jgi:hypothetical protein
MDNNIMPECEIIPRRAQRILEGTIKIEPTCSQRLHLKVCKRIYRKMTSDARR